MLIWLQGKVLTKVISIASDNSLRDYWHMVEQILLYNVLDIILKF